MKVFYVTYPGSLNFGAWRDEMQALGWINEIWQKYKPLIRVYMDQEEMTPELKEMEMNIRDMLFGYADEMTKMKLKKDHGEVGVVIMYSDPDLDENSTHIMSFTIQDNFYQENLERIMKKNAGL